jgi:hypothetical protein
MADATMDYLNCLRQLVRENKIQKEEISSYTIIVGEAWGALLPRTS